jgi:bifunctional DNA-binding transcriptional regulator/antitoxin component of YhaV-PrlF toxin-antitoxin module
MTTEHTGNEMPLFTKIGKRGTMVIPATLRKQYGFTEGIPVVTEPHPEGVLIKAMAFQYNKKNTSDAWKNWLEVTQAMNLSADEINEFKLDGRK